MKRPLVSAVAVLFCCAILGTVGLFGWSRYKAAQMENAAFRAQLQGPGLDNQAAVAAHMPDQLPPRATSAGGNATSSPQPAQP
jgi:hypothetical protein